MIKERRREGGDGGGGTGKLKWCVASVLKSVSFTLEHVGN